MEPVVEILGKALRRLDHPNAALAWLSSAWPSIVGKSLAAHTQPVRCNGGRLELAADAKAWQHQLEDMQRELCARVNQAWGGKLVREVKFVAARPAPKPPRHEADNEHTPFVRRRRA